MQSRLAAAEKTVEVFQEKELDLAATELLVMEEELSERVNHTL